MTTIDPQGCLSVVMPCFNEETRVTAAVEAVLASPFVGELITVDDCSTDDTLSALKAIDDSRVRVLTHSVNQGKGAALRTGIAEATRPLVIVQDADLEYDPNDWERVLEPLLDGRAEVVFGSRFLAAGPHRVLYFWHSVGNKVLTLASNMTTNLNLTDMETCTKAFRREIIQSIEIEEDRFGFEPEIVAKVAAKGARIYEVGVTYSGRTYAEGKKIGWRDGIEAIRCIARYAPIRSKLTR